MSYFVLLMLALIVGVILRLGFKGCWVLIYRTWVQADFLAWRLRVSWIGSRLFSRWGWYGFADWSLDWDAYLEGYTARDYFIEAWCRE
jgi:hypothetical protein